MAKKNFETALNRLEEITQKLENGDLSLENSLKMFNEGIELAAFCSKQLSEAQKKVELLIQKDGKIDTLHFDGKTSGNKELPEQETWDCWKRLEKICAGICRAF